MLADFLNYFEGYDLIHLIRLYILMSYIFMIGVLVDNRKEGEVTTIGDIVMWLISPFAAMPTLVFFLLSRFINLDKKLF